MEESLMQNIDQTIASIPAMSVSDRLRLAEAMWDSLDDGSVPVLTQEQRTELDRRMSEHDANPELALKSPTSLQFFPHRLSRHSEAKQPAVCVVQYRADVEQRLQEQSVATHSFHEV